MNSELVLELAGLIQKHSEKSISVESLRDYYNTELMEMVELKEQLRPLATEIEESINYDGLKEFMSDMINDWLDTAQRIEKIKRNITKDLNLLKSLKIDAPSYNEIVSKVVKELKE